MDERDPSEIAKLFLSDDVGTIREGAFAILYSLDRQKLRNIAPIILPHAKQLDKMDMGGGFISNSHWVLLAIKKLEIALGEACLCNIVYYSEFLDPKRFQKPNFFLVLETGSDPKTWETTFTCVCVACRTEYVVTRNDGWHMPSFKWERMHL